MLRREREKEGGRHVGVTFLILFHLPFVRSENTSLDQGRWTLNKTLPAAVLEGSKMLIKVVVSIFAHSGSACEGADDLPRLRDCSPLASIVVVGKAREKR